MKRTIRPDSYPGRGRRGVTLVEMLVTVAMLVIIMTILVQVFQAATGALTAATTIQQLDDQLKLLDSTLRSDLNGVTAHFTPPLDPAQNLGYFEYGENEFADLQGEDSDDYIRFTAQAPPGRPFTGRMWVNSTGNAAMNNDNLNPSPQPATITSEYAEIIYFLRNGNLYRRVLLIAPELQSSIVPAIGNVPFSYPAGPSGAQLNLPNVNTFSPSALGGSSLSWQGVNDLSARPAATGPNANALSSLPKAQQLPTQAATTIVLNTLGDLTNRENRAFYPRFSNDFYNLTTQKYTPDGLADDFNGDNVPDLYPTLYPGVFNPGNVGNQLLFPPIFLPNNNTGVQFIQTNNALGISLLGFPYVFPGAYSKAQVLAGGDQIGWIHAPAPYAFVLANGICTSTAFDSSPLAYLEYMNHNPLDLGDNLPTQLNAPTGKTPIQIETTWWGFPTWRETLSPFWTDPTIQINVGGSANNAVLATAASPALPLGLAPLAANQVTNFSCTFDATGKKANLNLLPAMTALWRNTPQLFADGAGDPNSNGVSAFFPTTAGLWNTLSWEDDLIMTGVRSFDVKAYDNALGGYGDLGWGDDLRLYVPFQTTQGYLGPFTTAPYLGYVSGTSIPAFPFTVWPPVSPGGTSFSTINQTFAHEGRMPPLVEDNRLDYQNPNPSYVSFNNFVPQYATTFPNYSSNVGDSNAGVVRLRRVWDTWSTEYSKAPANGVNTGNTNPNLNGFPAGPPFTPPIYPSYPPPYPAPLRGIQIQIRVADPASQRIKSLTIRQDFTDKL